MKNDINKTKVTIVAKIPKELDKLLIAEAFASHRSKSGMIAEIISIFFGGENKCQS